MAWHQPGGKPLPKAMTSQLTDWIGLDLFNTLRPRQNGRYFADDTFKHVFMNENVRISINISLKFVPKGLINNIPALVQIMAWRGPGDKPLSEPMLVSLSMHICVTRPQWINDDTRPSGHISHPAPSSLTLHSGYCPRYNVEHINNLGP